MMLRFDIYFWEPSTSPHKEYLLYELTKHPRISSILQIADAGISKERQSIGWSLEHIDNIATIISPTKFDILSIVDNSSEDSVHIFSGMHWNSTIVDGLSAVIRKGRRFGFLSEPRVFEGIKGVLRLLHSWCTEERFRQRASFVLAIGRNAPSWFSLAGFNENVIFPFAYFVRDPGPLHDAGQQNPVRIGFLGRLIRLKGINLFLDALPHVKHQIRVRIAGAGEQQRKLENFASTTDLPVEYIGAINIQDVHTFLSSVDILVVPSLTADDGWAAVVSEGLLAGAAIVATQQVGASICLDVPYNGHLVVSKNKYAVANAIDRVISDGLLSPHARIKRSEWARRHLTASAGANHLVSILDHVFCSKERPRPFYL